MSKLAEEIMKIADEYRADAHFHSPAAAYKRARDKVDELLQPVREASQALLAIVNIQNGNLHADINQIQDAARAALALLAVEEPKAVEDQPCE